MSFAGTPASGAETVAPVTQPVEDEGAAPEVDTNDDEGPQLLDGEEGGDGEPVEGDQQPVAPEDAEIEYEGEKFKVPAKLKDAFLMRADYTKKTQEVAEARRAVEQQAESSRALIQEHAKAFALSEQVKAYENVDWATLESEDPVRAATAWRQFTQLKDQRDEAVRGVMQKEQERTLSEQRETAKQVEEGRAVLARDIPDWSPEYAGKLVNHAVSKFGFTPQEVGAITDPRMIKVLNAAFKNAEAGKTQAKVQNIKTAQAVTPAPEVRPSGTVARKTTDASGDKLSMDEWAKRERERVAKKKAAR